MAFCDLANDPPVCLAFRESRLFGVRFQARIGDGTTFFSAESGESDICVQVSARKSRDVRNDDKLRSLPVLFLLCWALGRLFTGWSLATQTNANVAG